MFFIVNVLRLKLKIMINLNLNLFFTFFLIFVKLLMILKFKLNLRIYIIASRKIINVYFKILYYKCVEIKRIKLNILNISINYNKITIVLKRAKKYLKIYF